MGHASVWDLGFPGGSGGGSSHRLSYPREVLLAFLWWEHLSWRPVRAQGSEGMLEERDGPQDSQSRPGVDCALAACRPLVSVLYSH